MLVLILINGFYVTGEFALVAVDRSRIEADASAGNRGAARTLGALKELSFHLSGAQLGITVTSLLVGFVLEPTLGRTLLPVAEAVGVPEASALEVALTAALVIATATQMLLGELLPKNIAIAEPTATAYAVVGPLRVANSLMRPVIVFLNSSANVTVRAIGIEPEEELIAVRSRAELRRLISDSRAQGALAEEQASLLSRSISFGDKTAADALVPRFSVKAISGEASLADLADFAVSTGHSRFPVYGNDLDDIVGIVHAKDAFRIPAENRQDTPVAAIMREPLIVPESRPLDMLLVDMRTSRQQIAIIADEYGSTAGIATFEDLVEEIVGDIHDEHDRADPAHLTPGMPDGVHVVSGLLHPDEVRDRTGFEMPGGGYETLAGFLLTLFDRIPEGGDHTSFDGWEFKIVAMDGRRISDVLVVSPPAEPEPEQRP